MLSRDEIAGKHALITKAKCRALAPCCHNGSGSGVGCITKILFFNCGLWNAALFYTLQTKSMENRRVIPVDSIRPLTTFSSAETAIQSMYANPRHHEAKRDSQLVRNEILLDVIYDDHRVEFLISNGKSLTIGHQDGNAVWSLHDADKLRPPDASSSLLDDREILRWERLGEIPWEREKLLRDRVGKRIKLLSASDRKFYIYCENCEHALDFGPLKNADTSHVFLWWCDGD